MSCLICCACALYMFHRGRVGNVFSIPLYVLTCKVIDNKATLTLTKFDFRVYGQGSATPSGVRLLINGNTLKEQEIQYTFTKLHAIERIHCRDHVSTEQ